LLTDTLNVVDSASSSPQQSALSGTGTTASVLPPTQLQPRGVAF
jgi:hypothetical protein